MASSDEQVNNAFAPGQILHLFCIFTEPSKYKFLVLVSVEPLLFFFINSEINSFKRNKPDLLNAQIEIKKSDYTFLDHDSFIDCSQVIEYFTKKEIEIQLEHDINNIKIKIDEATKKKILEAVKISKTITPVCKDAIIASLEN